MKTRVSITVDEIISTWRGSFTFDVLDASGAFVRSDCGKLEATRIEPF